MPNLSSGHPTDGRDPLCPICEDTATQPSPQPRSISLFWVGFTVMVIVMAAILLLPRLFNSDEAKIRNRLDTFTAALNNQDAEEYLRCITSQNRRMLTDGIQFDDTPTSIMEILSVEIDGATATARVRRTSGDEVSEETCYLQREDGEWYVDVVKTIRESLKEAAKNENNG